MHRNKPFMTNDTAQGRLVNVMGHHREILIRMAVGMAAGMAAGMVVDMAADMDMEATLAAAVDATEGVRCLS
jgi:hypothetical protein